MQLKSLAGKRVHDLDHHMIGIHGQLLRTYA